MANCFIIMPITTPDEFVSKYSNDKDHFKHVMEHLFKPAIEKSGHIPMSPSAIGSDLIHAEIIKRLELDGMVLCDMSTLNPNVFFELGIRTALDKPTCLVRDVHTESVPFDASVINHHKYDSTLAPWKLKNEIEHLAEHITKSFNSSNEHNTLWSYFGLTQRSEASNTDSPLEDKVDLILRRIDTLENSQNQHVKVKTFEATPSDPDDLIKWISKGAEDIINKVSAKLSDVTIDGDTIIFNIRPYIIAQHHVEEIKSLAHEHGFKVKIDSDEKIHT